MKILIVGEMPTESAGLVRAFEGSGSGYRLEKLLGVQPGELSLVVDTINLVPYDGAGREIKWAPREAFQRACRVPIEDYDRTILCGAKVAGAFGMKDAILFNWVELHRDERRCVKFYVPATSVDRTLPGVPAIVARIPHPSGLSRWWNDPDNRVQAQTFMAGLGLARRLF